MFYYDDALNVYYRSTTDGVTWSSQTTYNITWPNPYTSNLLFWTQLTVSDAGNPILVFDFLDNDDYSTGTYPYIGSVWICTGEAQACVCASTPYTRAWYPTVASNGNTVVALYHVARGSSGVDSLAFQDVVAATSTDGGATFGIHQNMTSSLTNRPGLAQLAMRLDLTNGNFFYFYGVNITNNHDPIWHAWRDPEGLDPHRWYVGWQELGVEEHNATVPTKPMLNLVRIRYQATPVFPMRSRSRAICRSNCMTARAALSAIWKAATVMSGPTALTSVLIIWPAAHILLC